MDPASPTSVAEERREGMGEGYIDPELQEQFRQFQRYMERQQRPIPPRRSGGEDDEDGQTERGGASGPPPEWGGDSPFEDYHIRARLWVATTKTRPRARGPCLLKALRGPPFEAFKHLARDPSWLSSDTNAEDLLQRMDTPEYYGEDKEEHLLAALARITFHLKRGKSESWQEFFSRWENGLRKVREHSVDLPDVYLGFLLIHGLRPPTQRE